MSREKAPMFSLRLRDMARPNIPVIYGWCHGTKMIHIWRMFRITQRVINEYKQKYPESDLYRLLFDLLFDPRYTDLCRLFVKQNHSKIFLIESYKKVHDEMQPFIYRLDQELDPDEHEEADSDVLGSCDEMDDESIQMLKNKTLLNKQKYSDWYYMANKWKSIRDGRPISDYPKEINPVRDQSHFWDPMSSSYVRKKS